MIQYIFLIFLLLFVISLIINNINITASVTPINNKKYVFTSNGTITFKKPTKATIIVSNGGFSGSNSQYGNYGGYTIRHMEISEGTYVAHVGNGGEKSNLYKKSFKLNSISPPLNKDKLVDIKSNINIKYIDSKYNRYINNGGNINKNGKSGIIIIIIN
jgi:hypothetical protein